MATRSTKSLKRKIVRTGARLIWPDKFKTIKAPHRREGSRIDVETGFGIVVHTQVRLTKAAFKREIRRFWV